MRWTRVGWHNSGANPTLTDRVTALRRAWRPLDINEREVDLIIDLPTSLMLIGLLPSLDEVRPAHDLKPVIH